MRRKRWERNGLETIRLLSNLETERHKLLQIVMFGQSELDELLSQPNLRQINQRIGFSFGTGPLTMDEAIHYMNHRIEASRLEGIEFPIFDEGAVRLLASSAQFIPRVINILADKALLVAYGEGSIQVTDHHAEAAIDDSPQIASPVRFHRSTTRRILMGVIALEMAAVVALFVLSPTLQFWAKDTFDKAVSVFSDTPPAAPPAVE